MTRSLSLCLAFVSLWMVKPTNANDLLPPHVIRQLGLTQAWARPVQVPAGSQSIADQKLFVHESNPREYVEIVVPAETAAPANGNQPAADAGASEATVQGKVLARIPTDRVSVGGQPIGRKEAERLATNEIRRLKRRGVEAVINVRTVPRVHLYTIGNDGTLECRDAESGEPLWMVRVGNRRLPYSAIGTSEDLLTVINGANLIQVEAATGEVIEEVRMSGAPRFGAINSGAFAMIPMIGGGVAGYPLRDPTIDPFKEIVEGNALAMPTKAPGTTRIAWGTDRGFVYVMEMQGEPSVLFRLNTDGIVSGQIAAATGNRFFFGSEAGQVYGLWATRTGRVLWSRPFGEPFYNEPIVVGDQVLLRSTYGNLYSLGIDDGNETWTDAVPNINDMIAAFGGRLYVTTLSGSLAVIDLESGKTVGVFNDVKPGRLLPNRQTDRLYLVGEMGDVQCLRLEDAQLPTFNIQPDVQLAEEETAEKPAKPTTPFDPGSTDPFGAGGADPFGAGGADPFGGGGAAGDPFGGGDAAGDPFGGGGAADDPFGGNPFGN